MHHKFVLHSRNNVKYVSDQIMTPTGPLKKVRRYVWEVRFKRKKKQKHTK